MTEIAGDSDTLYYLSFRGSKTERLLPAGINEGEEEIHVATNTKE